MRRNGFFFAAAALVLVLDQITKAVVAGRMALGESIPVIPGLLSLTYIRNSGIAFGILNNGSGNLKAVLLAVSAVLALAFLVWLLLDQKKEDGLSGMIIGLVAGGAMGNLIDRLRLGEVVDFIDAFWRTHHWPAFNLADSAISVGVVLLIARQFFQGIRET